VSYLKQGFATPFLLQMQKNKLRFYLCLFTYYLSGKIGAMIKILVLMLMLGFNLTSSQAQDRIIHGIVTTLDSIPLIGVEIKIKSTKQSVKTDSLGRFTAVCNKQDKLKFEANGFYTENVNVHEKIKVLAVNLKLKPGEKQMNYAIGYGYVYEKDRTTPGSSTEINESQYSKFNNIYDIIISTGAQIKDGDIILRGPKSFQGSSAALIVVDNVIADYDYLSTLRPNDIKRIDILQDPASAVYGSRGANGVVLIETLKGK
jgi:TonB-dependent SusC/RagA subfamily outer membrane receptor